VLVVADAQPINRGHLLVLPVRHAPDLVALTAAEVIEMALAAQRADRAIRSTFPSVDGTNLVMSNGDAADQGVLHAHLHVIPRLEGDGYEFREDVSRYPLPPLTTDERDALRTAVSG
jgi:diadenosine tetraphosphate (Ap4A) HIT family hydrolase